MHEKYNPLTIENDIALLKISPSIEYAEKIAPIDLETAEIEPNTNVILTGWGYSTYPGSNPNDLQEIKLNTISLEECKEYHKKPLFDSQICTLTKKGEGACQGDSGGPLVLNEQQVGIVSWGKPCAVNYPDVFAKVSFYGEWIKRNSY